MDGFTYSDIFATKGIEYLVVIAFLILLVPFWLALNKQPKIVTQLRNALGSISFRRLKIPQGLYYGKNHTWLFMEKSGDARVGIDDLLIHLAGEIKCIIKASPGDEIKKGELLTELIQEGKKLRILSPVTGTITEINSSVEESPQILNDDPYGRGWIYKIKPVNWISEINDCYFASAASSWSQQELEKIKNFLAGSNQKKSPEFSSVILQDGGELSDHALSGFSATVWNEFGEEFLERPLGT